MQNDRANQYEAWMIVRWNGRKKSTLLAMLVDFFFLQLNF